MYLPETVAEENLCPDRRILIPASGPPARRPSRNVPFPFRPFSIFSKAGTCVAARGAERAVPVVVVIEPPVGADELVAAGALDGATAAVSLATEPDPRNG